MQDKCLHIGRIQRCACTWVVTYEAVHIQMCIYTWPCTVYTNINLCAYVYIRKGMYPGGCSCFSVWIWRKQRSGGWAIEESKGQGVPLQKATQLGGGLWAVRSLRSKWFRDRHRTRQRMTIKKGHSNVWFRYRKQQWS